MISPLTQSALILGIAWWMAFVFLITGLLQLLRWKRGYARFKEAALFLAISALFAISLAAPTLLFYIVFLLRDYPS